MADEITQDLDTASDALMEAFKLGEEMDVVLCIYQDKEGHLGYISNTDNVFSQIGLLEMVKQLMANRQFQTDHGEDGA